MSGLVVSATDRKLDVILPLLALREEFEAREAVTLARWGDVNVGVRVDASNRVWRIGDAGCDVAVSALIAASLDSGDITVVPRLTKKAFTEGLLECDDRVMRGILLGGSLVANSEADVIVVACLDPVDGQHAGMPIWTSTGSDLRFGITDEVATCSMCREVSEAAVEPVSMPTADQVIAATSSRVGRNESCPCGSGKKYKKCCAA